ncbi:MAG TPA: hypothetical protein VLJ79_01795 [Candidatus Binatia bacterium]|nr:hypothetical protein [Candidatus Binatia bacterium]
MKGLNKLLVVLATSTLPYISTVDAHEFIIKPQQLRVESGAKLPFSILATNLMKPRTGDELSLKILLDGKPLKSPVQATYDGFSRRYNTYAYAPETLEDGLAYVKVVSPGIRMVRVEKRRESKNRPRALTFTR